MAAQEADHTEGGRKEKHDRDGYGRPVKWGRYCSKHNLCGVMVTIICRKLVKL